MFTCRLLLLLEFECLLGQVTILNGMGVRGHIDEKVSCMVGSWLLVLLMLILFVAAVASL